MTIAIPLGERDLVTLIDEQDLPLVAGAKWYVQVTNHPYGHNRRYAVGRRPGEPRQLKLHRVILGLTNPSVDVDHINGNGLDNRRSNLRIATRSQNTAAGRMRTTYAGKPVSSQYRGVCWEKRRRKWKSYVGINGRLQNLGYFDDEVEAAKTFDLAAWDWHGEFARLNFPLDWAQDMGVAA